MEDDSESSAEYGEEGVEVKHLLLGDIQLEEKIGQGGQASVYVAKI